MFIELTRSELEIGENAHERFKPLMVRVDDISTISADLGLSTRILLRNGESFLVKESMEDIMTMIRRSNLK